MRVLATNDDGVGATGLATLAAAVTADGHDVVVVAPHADASGSAASLGVVVDRSGVRMAQHRSTEYPSIPAYAVEAPPALGVRAVCAGVLGWRPDLVVSGVNPGYNTGRLILHSGTVGAAYTAASLGVCGVAFSTATHPAHGNQTAARVATLFIRALLDAGLPPIVVNVNVPDLPFDEIRGLAFTTPGRTSKTDVAFELVDETLVLRRRDNPPPYELDGEAHLLARGHVAVSVLALPWGLADTSECVESAIARNWPVEVQG